MDDLSYLAHPPYLPALALRSQMIAFDMASEPLLGALLQTLAASKPAGRFLEIGTGTGIASAWLLEGMDARSTLTTIDINAEYQQVARDILGHDPRLDIRTIDALEFLAAQPPASYDLIFADALPGKYEGLELALAAVKPGGFYVVDDLLPQPNWPEGHAAKVPRLLDELASHAGFILLPLVWSSGIAVAVRR